MKLSIVIVNYNVQHFLESCLGSVMLACEGIEAEVFVVDNDSVVAVDQWRDFRVGDPAKDLAWLTTPASSTFANAVLTSYRSARPGADRWVMQRARFYAELDVARWLLHGIDVANDTITEDATTMLSALHDRVSGDMDQALTQPISQAKHPLEN